MLFARSHTFGSGGSAHAGGSPRSGIERVKLGGNDGIPGILKPHTLIPLRPLGANEDAAEVASCTLGAGASGGGENPMRRKIPAMKKTSETAKKVNGQRTDLEVPRPFLKWVGGKKRLLGVLRKHVPETFGSYWELCVGGGALFFDLAREGKLATRKTTLSDSNAQLITTYISIRDEVDDVIEILRDHAKKHGEKYFYEVRAKEPAARAVAAARFLYLNRAGFNGLYRENSKGACNTPWGDGKPVSFDEENLRACSRVLQNVEIVRAEFNHIATTDRHGPQRGDFVYFDPPYIPKTKSVVRYNGKGFTETEQRLLAERATLFKKRGVHVVLTNSDTPLAHALYPAPFWNVDRVELRGDSVNQDPTKRGKIAELVIS